MEFQTKHEPLLKLLQQADEFTYLLRAGADFPASHYHDAQAHLKRAALPGAYLDVAAFFEVKMSLRTIRQALSFFAEAAPSLYPTLRLLGIGMQVDRNLLAALDKVVDDDGAVRDDASPAAAPDSAGADCAPGPAAQADCRHPAPRQKRGLDSLRLRADDTRRAAGAARHCRAQAQGEGPDSRRIGLGPDRVHRAGRGF